MKPGGHPIGLRLSGRMAELRNRLSRARYFRGHGVHSPFVYTIVREVFMRRELLPGDRALYGAYRGGAGALRRLRTAGIVPAVGRGAPFDIGG